MNWMLIALWEGCMRLQGTARSMDVSLVLQEAETLAKRRYLASWLPSVPSHHSFL